MSTALRPARSPQGSTAPRGEIKALTGLRAVAATWVVLYHFQGQLWPITDQAPFLKPLLNAGWTGVELFFVLSGVVIARSYLDECGRRWSTRGALRFLFNRFARVWPAYAVVTVVAFSLILVAQDIGLRTDVVSPHPAADLRHLASQLSMTQMWGRDTLVGSSFVNPAWSISAEWLAYLCFPLLALAMCRFRRLHPAVSLTLAVAATAPLFLRAFQEGPHDTEVNWVLRIACCFVAGVFVSLAVRGMEERKSADSWGLFLSVVSLAGVVLACFWNTWRRAGDPTVDFAGVVTACYPLLVAGLMLTRRGPARVLASAPLLYGGRISYCLYLVHFLVKEVALTLVWRPGDAPGALTPGLVLAVPALVLLSGVLAAGLHHGVEEPARRLLLALWRRLPGEAGRRRVQVAAVPAAPALVTEARGLRQVLGPPTQRLAAVGGMRQPLPVRPALGHHAADVPRQGPMTVVPRRPIASAAHGVRAGSVPRSAHPGSRGRGPAADGAHARTVGRSS